MALPLFTRFGRDRVILAGVIFVTLLAQVLLYPGIADLVDALGATTDLDASMWFLVAEFGAFVAFAAVWGALSDRAGRRIPFIALGATIAATCYLLMAIGGTLWGLSFETVLGLRIIQGAGSVGAFSLAITMLMDLEGGHGRNMGAAGIAIGSGTALGAPIGGALSAVAVILPLVIASLLFFVVVLLVLAVPDRAPSGGRPSVVRVIGDLRRQPDLGLPYAFGFIDRMTAGTFSLVGVFYFRDEFGLDPFETGLFLMLFFAPFALFQYPFGTISDRVGRFIPVVGGSLCFGSAIILVGQMPSLTFLAITMLFVGIFGALVAPATMALVTDISRGTRRGVGMAGFNIAGSLGFLAGIVIGTLVADAFGFPAAFAVIGGLEILIALASIPWFRRLHSHVPAVDVPGVSE